MSSIICMTYSQKHMHLPAGIYKPESSPQADLTSPFQELATTITGMHNIQCSHIQTSYTMIYPS